MPKSEVSVVTLSIAIRAFVLAVRAVLKGRDRRFDFFKLTNNGLIQCCAEPCFGIESIAYYREIFVRLCMGRKILLCYL